MNEEIKEYLSKYPIEMINRFEELRQLIHSTQDVPTEVLNVVFRETLQPRE